MSILGGMEHMLHIALWFLAVLTAAIIGAGPSGLMAAEVLAQGGARVTVHDRMAAPARKFLLAGRGGLNLTHSEPLDRLLDRYGPAREMLEPAIRAFPPQAVIDWCHGLGIETFVGSSGRVFPRTMKASPLLRAWLKRLDGLGVELKRRSEWRGPDGSADITILAMGGASWPKLGSDGNWVPVLRGLGVEIRDLTPCQQRRGHRLVGTFLRTLCRHALEAHRSHLRRANHARRSDRHEARARRRA